MNNTMALEDVDSIVSGVIEGHEKLGLVAMVGSAITSREFREKIFEFERSLARIPNSFVGDSDQCPLKHSFANGIYVREIFLPKGVLLTGRIHKCDHPNFILSGDVSVVTEFDGVQRLKAPQSMISKAGTKRLVYAHADTVWVTIHRTDETDPSKLVDEITVGTYEEFNRISERLQLCQ